MSKRVALRNRIPKPTDCQAEGSLKQQIKLLYVL